MKQHKQIPEYGKNMVRDTLWHNCGFVFGDEVLEFLEIKFNEGIAETLRLCLEDNMVQQIGDVADEEA